jgi:hypothetical protein
MVFWPHQYPQQLRDRGLRMVEEPLPELETEFVALMVVARKLGISREAIRCWKHQRDFDSGQADLCQPGRHGLCFSLFGAAGKRKEVQHEPKMLDVDFRLVKLSTLMK